MRITLNDDEIRIALAKTLESKVDYKYGDIDHEECWFEVKSPDGKVEDIESVEFSVEV